MSSSQTLIQNWQARSIPTPRLNLRAFRPEDGDDLYAYLYRPEVYRFEPGEPLDCQQARERAQEFSTSPEFWAVELRAEGKVIGQVYFSQTEPQHLMTWELGYILSPDYQHQGYASEAAAALVQAGFAAAGIHRIGRSLGWTGTWAGGVQALLTPAYRKYSEDSTWRTGYDAGWQARQQTLALATQWYGRRSDDEWRPPWTKS